MGVEEGVNKEVKKGSLPHPLRGEGCPHPFLQSKRSTPFERPISGEREEAEEK